MQFLCLLLDLDKQQRKRIYKYIILYFYSSYLPNPSARAGYDTRSIFKRSLTCLNSEFSFSLTSCLTKAEEPCLSYYLPIAGGRIIGFIPFPRVLVLIFLFIVGNTCVGQECNRREFVKPNVLLAVGTDLGQNSRPYIVLKPQRNPHENLILHGSRLTPTHWLFFIGHGLHPFNARSPWVTAYTLALLVFR